MATKTTTRNRGAAEPSGPGWHLQLRHTEWVVWGYGPGPGGVRHIDVARNVIRIPVEGRPPIVSTLTFNLPDSYPGGEQPAERERRTCWAWRFRTNDYMHDSHWKLCDSREQAMEEAKAWSDREGERLAHRGEANPFEAALRDVRQYPIDE